GFRRQRRAMARVVGDEPANTAATVFNDQHREIVIDGPTLGAAIDGKCRLRRSPIEPALLSILDCREGDILELPKQFASVTFNPCLLLRGDVGAKAS
ncbi:MAG: hypothetical protein ACREF9_14160, partial [Opitutaceae bacterium]